MKGWLHDYYTKEEIGTEGHEANNKGKWRNKKGGREVQVFDCKQNSISYRGLN